MERSATLGTPRQVHLIGLMLVASAVMLGITLTLAVLLLEREGRLASQPVASANPVSAPAEPAASVSAPAEPAASVSAPAEPAASVAAAAANPAVPAARAGSAGGPKAGSAVYGSSCAGCHPKGKAGLGPDLRGLSDEEMTRGVRNGKGTMPAYPSARLSDQQLADIIAFLRAD